MSFDLDWQALRRPLWQSAASLLAAVLLVGAAYAYRDFSRETRDQWQTQVMQLRARYHEIKEAERIVEALYQDYRRLQRAGFVGRRSRILWVDAVRRAAEAAGLGRLHYRLGAFQALDTPADPGLDTAGLRVYRSDMALRMELLHEGQLLAFLEGLLQAGTGGLQLRECRIARIGERIQAGPNLNAVCHLHWYAVDVPRAGDEDADADPEQALEGSV